MDVPLGFRFVSIVDGGVSADRISLIVEINRLRRGFVVHRFPLSFLSLSAGLADNK